MLLFGAAEVDLTPPEPLPLGGYTERRSASFEPGGDKLWARARAVGDIMLVSVEMLTVPESLVAAVRARTGERKLFLAATHTHCAPDSQMLNDRMTLSIPGIASFRRRWLEWYADRISAAITSARRAQNREIVSFELRQINLPLARSRRTQGVPDNIATQVDVNLAGVGKVPLFRVFGAHPTLFGSDERKLRGDWPGSLMARHEGLVFTGAIGDCSPVPPHPGGSAVWQSNTFANQIASGLQRARLRVLEPKSLEFATVPIRLDSPTPHPDFAKSQGISASLAQSVVSKFAPPKGSLLGVSFGSFCLIGVPGEPTGEVGRSIRQFGRAQKMDVAVTSHVNGWIGYVLTPTDYSRGGYESQLAMHGQKTGTRVVDAAKLLLRQLSQTRN